MVKNHEHLTDEDQTKLSGMFATSPELFACHAQKEDFRALFNRQLDATEAEKQLQDWVAKVEASPFKALKKFVGTLRNWWQQILNYFPARFNNGFAEGANLKIKMLNRHGFGYRNFKSFCLTFW